MKTGFYIGMSLLLTLAFLPATVQVQETPQQILKKAAVRIERAKTYQFHGRLESAAGEEVITAQVMFFHEGKKQRFELGTIVSSREQQLPENARVVMVRDGKHYSMTFTGFFAYVCKDDGKGVADSGVSLPAPKDVDRFGCRLYPPQTLEGKTVNPIVVENEDKTETTYYIEAGTYRLVQIRSKSEINGKATEIKVVFESETLNARLPSDIFKFVPPANSQPMPASFSKTNPFALFTGGFTPGSSK